MNSFEYHQPDASAGSSSSPTMLEATMVAMSAASWPLSAVLLFNQRKGDPFGILLTVVLFEICLFLLALVAMPPWRCRALRWITVSLAGVYVFTAVAAWTIGILLYG